MRVFIVGGSKSGKSDFSQEVALRLANGGKHYYVATLMPTNCDADHAIIRSHLDRRAGMGFETIECGRKILTSLDHGDSSGTFLLDSVTTLLSNELYPVERMYQPDEEGALRCADELIAWSRSVANAVIVSDDLFRDGIRYEADTDLFRRHLGAIHCRLARECDVVMEMAFGTWKIRKGEWL